jgi:hypothetical protein
MINQNWIFGKNCGLHFSTGNPPSPITTPVPSIDTHEGCASISDTNGNLLFYTNGVTVWDSNGNAKYSGLHGNDSSTQSAIIVPNPGNYNQYYVFTTAGSSGSPHHFDGIRVDIDTWPPLPVELSSLMTIPTTSGFFPTEKLTAVQHKNCIDYWVITIIKKEKHEEIPESWFFRVFLVNSTGISHAGDTQMNTNVYDIGYLKASPKGNRLAFANWSDPNVLVYHFDNSTGFIDIPGKVTIPVPDQITNYPNCSYGVEFSPNGNMLYYSTNKNIGTISNVIWEGRIYQVDLTTTIFPTTPVVTHKNPNDERYALGALQLGMDGVIYIAKDAESSLGGILNPNVPGTGCNVNMSYIPNLANGICLMGLPNLIPNPCPCPCEKENCDEETKEANKILDSQCNRKRFTIIANGQTFPVPCRPAFPIVNLKPIFTLHWGDGPSDKLESHDTEIIFFRIHNPFNNIIFKRVKIFNMTITPNQTLPDGGNALLIIPSEIACFDEILPCSHVSRDFAFFIQNCIPGPYQISFDYCIEEITIVGNNEDKVSFRINVVAS